MSTLQLKEKATAFLMSRMGKTAYVSSITNITATLLQVDLYLPEPLSNWRSTQHLKCEIAKLAYRDYTLAHWDAATQTATLLIHTGHNGAGSNWARQLQPAQPVLYAGPGGGIHQPATEGKLVCIGDASAIGHFASLYTRRHDNQPFHVLVTAAPGEVPPVVSEMPLQVITYSPASYNEQLTAWLHQYNISSKGTTFYVAGYIPLVIQAKKLLKHQGAGRIKSAGFWK